MCGLWLFGWGYLYLIAVSEGIYFDVAENLRTIVKSYKEVKYLSQEIFFAMHLSYKLIRPMHLAPDKQKVMYWNTVNEIKQLIQEANLKNGSIYNEITLMSISDRLIKLPILVKYNQVASLNNYENISQYEIVVNEGSPNTSVSDVCLSQVVSTKSCVISSKCLDIMDCHTKSYGYHRTHQLLFFLLIYMSKCSNNLRNSVSIDLILYTMCSEIYRENLILQHWNISLEYMDLYTEQSLFCGIAGYSEYLSASAVKPVMTWHSTYFKPKAVNTNEHLTSLEISLYSNLIGIHYLFHTGGTSHRNKARNSMLTH